MDPNQQPMTPPPVSAPQPAAPAPQPNYAPPAPTSKTDGLGIAAIALAFLGFSPIAFILGLIGASKAKKDGRSPILSRVGWIWGLVGTLAWLILIPLLILGLLSVGSDNKKFMNAVFDKDYETACTMWDAQSGEDRKACESFLDKVNDEYSSYKAGEIQSLNGEITMDITLTRKDGGEDEGYVTVENGGVTKFIYGLGGSAGTIEDDMSVEGGVAGTIEEGTALQCLAKSSVTAVYPYVIDKWVTGDMSDDGKDTYLLDYVFFNADSTSYEFASTQNGNLDKMASIYLDNSSSDVMYKIRGNVKEGSLSSAGEALAQDRFEKVKNELVSRGVPSSRIVQLASKNVPSNLGGEKNVEVIAVTDCRGSGR